MANDRDHAYTLSVVGVDTGGTFTDFVLRILSEDPSQPAHTVTHKVLSTPDNPARAVTTGLRELLQKVNRSGKGRLTMVHGSTVATNALLEHKGVRTAFITTQGFEDLLLIGRQTRPSLYDLRPVKRPPFIDESLTFGVHERITSDGSVLVALTDSEIDRVVQAVAKSGAESVALCLLFSFLSPQHEERLAKALEQQGLFVSASHQVLPEYREYERASTTAINAYVSPLMQRYLGGLASEVAQAGVERLHVMQSSGGCISPENAGELGVHTVLSGPAGGVIGAFAAAHRTSLDHIITFDMGGTSTDVSLIPGQLQTTTEGAIDGSPIRVPILAIHTVGAGGGSIAYLDEGGALKVGPRSAGARPGPACYGQGGTEPTVTDAHVVLGRLPAEFFLGGRMQLDVSAAQAAISRLADRMQASVHATAWGILQVANVQMERAIRVISIEKGYDPKEFTLVSFGGAGGLHTAELARSLGLPQVLVPPHPGLLSAWGMSVADVVKTSSQGIIGRLDDRLDEGIKALQRLMEQSALDLRREARVDGQVYLQPSVDLRYMGQSFELTVDLNLVTWDAASDAMPGAPTADLIDLAERFHQAHLKRYGHRSGEPLELVAVRLRAWCKGHMTDTTQSVGISLKPFAPQPVSHTKAYFDGGWQSVPIYPRHQLLPGATFTGPAIVTEEHSTTVVGPGDQGQVDEIGNLLVIIDGAS